MPHNQNIGDKSIHCISCGKVIAKGHISSGVIAIKCKCGVMNTIKAETKPEGQVKRVFVDTSTRAFSSRPM